MHEDGARVDYESYEMAGRQFATTNALQKLKTVEAIQKAIALF